jgi:uncharacterized glyoxalase superfamily protein PhnB
MIMAKKVKAIPEGFHTITPHLVVKDGAKALDFYRQAFGAEVNSALKGPDGKNLMHAELRIGDSVFMLSDEFPEWGVRGPLSLGGTPVTIHLYTENADAAFKRALDAGCTVKMPLGDAFWGDRYGQVVDPFGHQWSIATHIQDLTPEEIEKGMASMNMEKP